MNDRLPSSIGTLRRLRAAVMLSPTSSVRHSENHSPYPNSSLSFFHIYGKRLQQAHISRHKMSRTSLQKAEPACLPFPPNMNGLKAVRPGRTARTRFSSLILRAQDFLFLICIDMFSFCFYGFWRLNILDTRCKLFQYAARYLANLTQLLFIYLQYVNNKYSEISTINDNIFHNFPSNEFVTLPRILSSH